MGRNEILSIVFCNPNRTSERLAETSAKLLVEKQQKQTLLDTINMRPSLDLPYGRNVNNSSLFNRNVALRENVVIPTSNSWRSNNDLETFLIKVGYFILPFFPWVSDF